MSDFYIGYLPKAPVTLARRMRLVIALLALLSSTLAVVLVYAQQRFPPVAFEFLDYHAFAGIVEEGPYPALVVSNPGGAESRYLLVGPGKRGASELVRGLNGRPVRLRAQLIYREQHTMLEVEPSSIQVTGLAAVVAAGETRRRQLVVVSGEIVDTKCYFGVMNPGRGKVHRDCAGRCISGGLPPALIERQGDVYLLVGPDGRALEVAALHGFVGEPVTIRGKFLASTNQRLLAVSHIARASD